MWMAAGFQFYKKQLIQCDLGVLRNFFPLCVVSLHKLRHRLCVEPSRFGTHFDHAGFGICLLRHSLQSLLQTRLYIGR